MRRLLLLLVLGLVGCGDGEEGQSAAGGGSAKVDCASSSENLRVKEIVDPPKGHELIEIEPTAAKNIAAQFEKGLGDKLKGYDGKVLVRRGEDMGTGMIVLNTTERTDEDAGSELIKGFEEGAEERGFKAGRIEIGGKEGVVGPTSDGAFIAMAPTGSCSVLVLVATTEKRLRGDATAVGS